MQDTTKTRAHVPMLSIFTSYTERYSLGVAAIFMIQWTKRTRDKNFVSFRIRPSSLLSSCETTTPNFLFATVELLFAYARPSTRFFHFFFLFFFFDRHRRPSFKAPKEHSEKRTARDVKRRSIENDSKRFGAMLPEDFSMPP